jgi:hypothetical protein
LGRNRSFLAPARRITYAAAASHVRPSTSRARCAHDNPRVRLLLPCELRRLLHPPPPLRRPAVRRAAPPPRWRRQHPSSRAALLVVRRRAILPLCGLLHRYRRGLGCWASAGPARRHNPSLGRRCALPAIVPYGLDSLESSPTRPDLLSWKD